MLQGVNNRISRWLHGRDFGVWHAPEYRLPFSAPGFDARRADFALWYLLERRAIGRKSLRQPRRAEQQELARVHTPELLASLGRPETLARVFACDQRGMPVDQVMSSVRLACGATIDAARELLRPTAHEVGRRALNLFGGFHHAKPGAAGGFCALNDIAIAVAALRAEGFKGRVLVLDLDAHPPDGTAACLEHDPSYWIGSLSCVSWGELPNVDETVLPPGCGDTEYLQALEALLARMPPGDLAFVCAGGDVLAGDPLGGLGLSFEACRERDFLAIDALSRVPSVWLPAGGYTSGAWRALAGSGLALGLRSRTPIAAGYDPMAARFSYIARSLAPESLGRGELDMNDVAEELGLGTRGHLLLGYYSAEGLEHALHVYGVLDALRRLGYGPFRAELEESGVGDSARLLDVPSGEPLIEVVVEKRSVAGGDMLYVHWLALRNPKASFAPTLQAFPGQTVPGLGLSREITEMLIRMAVRLGLEGLAMRPSAYHLAHVRRDTLHFVDPARQGRFEALCDALKDLPLVDASKAVAEGRARLNGQPYAWEPDEMVRWVTPRPSDRAAIDASKARSIFTLA
jgi:acetoin utilization deacetylase AcuC-like enzyme